MSSDDRMDRAHLPTPGAARTGPIAYDAKEPGAKNPPIAGGGGAHRDGAAVWPSNDDFIQAGMRRGAGRRQFFPD